MENNSELKNQNILPELHLSSEQKLNCYKNIHTSLLKLLDLIESELGEGKQRYQNKEKIDGDKININLWFQDFIYTIYQCDKLCNYTLTKVFVKIHGLYDLDETGVHKYKSLSHREYKNQIMESREIVKHLIDEEQKKIEEEKNSR